MTDKGFAIFLGVGMIVTGSVNTLSTKLADVTSSKGIDGTTRDFEHPFFQALGMFLGELCCLPVFYYLQWKYKDSDEYAPRKSFSPWLLALTALCDMVATSLMYVGLNMTYASVFQMLRGSVVIFTGILSKVFLKRQLYPFQWLGMFFVLLGLGGVGLASVLGGGSDDANAPDPILGDILIISAQVVVAIHMVLQEKFISKHNLPVLQVVGTEGLFGFIFTSFALVFLYLIPGSNGDGHVEDSPDAIVQISNSWVIPLALSGNVISIAFFNWFGASVTKYIDSTTRMVLDSVRTFVIWGVSLGVGWQDFNYLQVIGFALLLTGTAVYNKIVVVPVDQCRPPKEEAPLDKGIQEALDKPLIVDPDSAEQA